MSYDLALDGLAGAMRKVEAPGVEAFAARLRADQEAGNQTLAAVLEEVHAGALADRLRALVASAERLAHEAEIDEEEPEVAATVPSADGAGDQSAARVGGEPGAGAPEEAAA
ncbi:MAG: hypothetical protein KY452_09695 [Actinobacteria bacterium]|nr:hypothetical protein [Actinomycetota bacterium]